MPMVRLKSGKPEKVYRGVGSVAPGAQVGVDQQTAKALMDTGDFEIVTRGGQRSETAPLHVAAEEKSKEKDKEKEKEKGPPPFKEPAKRREMKED